MFCPSRTADVVMVPLLVSISVVNVMSLNVTCCSLINLSVRKLDLMLSSIIGIIRTGLYYLVSFCSLVVLLFLMNREY